MYGVSPYWVVTKTTIFVRSMGLLPGDSFIRNCSSVRLFWVYCPVAPTTMRPSQRLLTVSAATAVAWSAVLLAVLRSTVPAAPDVSIEAMTIIIDPVAIVPLLL